MMAASRATSAACCVSNSNAASVCATRSSASSVVQSRSCHRRRAYMSPRFCAIAAPTRTRSQRAHSSVASASRACAGSARSNDAPASRSALAWSVPRRSRKASSGSRRRVDCIAFPAMMMRSALILCLASCGSAASFKPAPLPPLVAAKPSERPISPHELLLVPGEHMIYEVHVHGITVGKVEESLGETEVESHFQTDSIAAALATGHHDLSTVLARGNARAVIGSEQLVIGDDAKHFDVDGKNGQTVHTALGLLRAWVASDAVAGFMTVQELGHSYRMT